LIVILSEVDGKSMWSGAAGRTTLESDYGTLFSDQVMRERREISSRIGRCIDRTVQMGERRTVLVPYSTIALAARMLFDE
jgi:hypothetical protein